jgi:hypothetical protein
LRGLVAATLDGASQQLPSHVAQELEGRIQSAARKNAAMDTERYESLVGKLEFSDLRELQGTITNKALWPYFEPRFAHKEVLNAKFSQLAELRNGIRHSRSVDEITRKEGEAAIIWFEQVVER